MSEDFQTYVVKCLFLCKRARPDIQTTVAFLTTRVMQTDYDDWKKLIRLMSYLKDSKDLVLTLEAADLNILKWYVDASYAAHNDMRGHTGAALTLGKGAIFNKSTTNQNTCVKSLSNDS